jgi:hypothetical protein
MMVAACALSCTSLTGLSGGASDGGASDGAPDAGDSVGEGGATDTSTSDGAPCVGPSQTDPKNCGACGHDCLGGACDAGVCQPAVVATGQLAPTTIAVDQAGVYWTSYGASTASPQFSNGAVMRADKAGGPAKPIAPSQLAPDHVRAMGGALYWCSAETSTVSRMPNGGAAITPLNASETNGSRVRAIAVDGDAGIVAWTEDGTSVVRGVPSGGGTVTTLAQTSTGNVEMAGLALDDKWLYYSQLVPTGVIFRIARDACASGSCSATPIPTAAVYVYALASDGQRLYYVDSQTPAVGVVSDSVAATIHAVAGGLMTDIALDADWVYWTEYGPSDASDGGPRVSQGVVARAKKDLSHLEVLATGQNHPRGIAVDDFAIYWTIAGTRTGNCANGCCDPGCFDLADGQVMRLAKPPN